MISSETAPILYIFSGLPGVGKSTLAVPLAKHFGAQYLRIDSIEQSLKDIYPGELYDQGYRLAFDMAKDCLRQGLSVVGDSCNTVNESRLAWQHVAVGIGVKFVNIEVVCSDAEQHRKQVENRPSTIDNLILPTWQQVQEREYHPWQVGGIRLDTANKTVQQSLDELRALLAITDWKHVALTTGWSSSFSKLIDKPVCFAPNVWCKDTFA